MEINIAVSLGPDRTPQASVISNNFLQNHQPIRSTAIFDDVSYVDLNFQSPENTAQFSTDGIIRQSPSHEIHLVFKIKIPMNKNNTFFFLPNKLNANMIYQIYNKKRILTFMHHY